MVTYHYRKTPVDIEFFIVSAMQERILHLGAVELNATYDFVRDP